MTSGNDKQALTKLPVEIGVYGDLMDWMDAEASSFSSGAMDGLQR